MPQDIELRPYDRLRIDSKREFEITKVLSKPQDAGMSSVYLAHRVDKPEMYGVIKVAKANNINALTREAEALKNLQNQPNPHPHIIRLVHPERAMWKERKGNQLLHFFALEYMDGGSLKDRLDSEPQGQLSLEQALPVAQAVGEALEFIHQQGMVHLDVKPANVLFSQSGRIVLSDFGVTRTVKQLQEVKRRVGTLPYNAPEQFETPPQHTPQVDIFALGMTFAEMLIGSKLYHRHRLSVSSASNPSHPSFGSGGGDMSYSKAEQEIFVQQVQKSLKGKIPAKAESIILKATAINPAERYESVREMLNALQSVAPKNSSPSSSSGVLLVGAIFGVLLTLAGIVGGVVWLLNEQTNRVEFVTSPPTTLSVTFTPAPVGITVGEELSSPTQTPSPSPTATLTPPTSGSASQASPTSTRRPTSTPVPTATPTATPRPAAIQPTTPPVSPGARDIVPEQQWIELIAPSAEQSIETADFEFRWRWQDQTEQNVCAQLPAGYGFEIRIWRDGLNPNGAMNAAEQQSNIQCDETTGTFSYNLPNLRGASGVAGESGGFLADIAIVQLNPYRVILHTPESTHRIILD